MRSLFGATVVATLLTSGCATTVMPVEAVIARARANEVAATREAQQADISVMGVVQEISFSQHKRLVTDIAGRRATTREQRHRGGPYVLLSAQDGTPVWCFLRKVNSDYGESDYVDLLSKGKRAGLVGRMWSVGQNDEGSFGVVLFDCRIESYER